MRDMNKVLLTGNLGHDPDLRVTPSGKAVARMSVASNRAVRQPDGSYRDQPEWFRVVLWDRLAQTAAEYLNKGSRVLVEGRLQTRQYQDRQGQARTTTEVIAYEMYLIGANGARTQLTGESDSEGSENSAEIANEGETGYEDEDELVLEDEEETEEGR